MENTAILQTLRAHGLRPTQQRVSIYRYLLDHPCHPTAEMIYQALMPTLPSCSLMTVYNALHALTEAGLISEITIEAQNRRFDGNVQKHGHFHCTHCGTIYDFPLPPENIQTALPDGFQVQEQQVYCSGICRNCAISTAQ